MVWDVLLWYGMCFCGMGCVYVICTCNVRWCICDGFVLEFDVYVCGVYVRGRLCVCDDYVCVYVCVCEKCAEYGTAEKDLKIKIVVFIFFLFVFVMFDPGSD